MHMYCINVAYLLQTSFTKTISLKQIYPLKHKKDLDFRSLTFDYQHHSKRIKYKSISAIDSKD